MDKAIQLYRSMAQNNHIAKRRLNVAKRQIRKTLNLKGNDICERLNIGFIDWYPGFEKDVDYIISIFIKAGLKANPTTVEDADILIAGHMVIA